MVNILNAESEIYFLGFRYKDKIILKYELLWSSRNLEAVISNVYIYVSWIYMYNVTLPIYLNIMKHTLKIEMKSQILKWNTNFFFFFYLLTI